MDNPRPEKEKPTPREQAERRRKADMSQVLGMRQVPPIEFDAGEKPEDPGAPIK